MPTKEESAALNEVKALARRNRQAGRRSFYWKLPIGKVVKFKKLDDVVIVKKVPRAVIYRWQRRQLRK